MHLCEVRLWSCCSSVPCCLFQSTHLREVRRNGNRRWQVAFYISIHAPAWGATVGLVNDTITLRISIHAPAWGATLLGAVEKYGKGISIHAPAWGATTSFRTSVLLNCKFQSTHLREVRLQNIRQDIGEKSISIHAPAWGATMNNLFK